ncbi:MAG TPA: hypothetical protein VFG61_02115 [Gaiellaceae bacterium]|jgi:hypothetical protein|nr:hypothetical protein [Gaiellaceae bacterium]
MPATESFDPITVLRALDGRRVAYIVIGGLGRVIQGSPGLTDGTDIVPSLRKDNLCKLADALADLNACRADGADVHLEEDLAGGPVLSLRTDAGELKVVPEPAGTRGYDDLRRAASREPLGSGLRPSVASLGDHARMLAAFGRDEDAAELRTVRRLIELERQLGLGLER